CAAGHSGTWIHWYFDLW
nr:immunoglobulin heavy chain junction region [Macaca mulatta]MOX60118.1 immunoglobulin heavy chain junction region [Macaca mulatta]MOX60867.1 immunoglobulin heavy chain junction region [Macaca mulatta]MOX61597.1 immunoglobulin heavy chain junction region [Macaca mulatta]MOX63989.1 immunoglobulin heavy chain junction region [Macaca mulatta]